MCVANYVVFTYYFVVFTLQYRLYILKMNLSKGYLPYIFTIPAILLLFGGYVLAGLYKFYDVEILSAGIAWPWLASFTGALVLGRTREKIEDERVNQVRNFSFRFLSELLIVGFFTISVTGLFFESWGTTEDALPGILLLFLIWHLYYLKIAVLFDGIDETTGKLKIGYHLLSLPFIIIVGIITYPLFIFI